MACIMCGNVMLLCSCLCRHDGGKTYGAHNVLFITVKNAMTNSVCLLAWGVITMQRWCASLPQLKSVKYFSWLSLCHVFV